MDPLSDHLTELNYLYAYLHRKRNISTVELEIWCHETFVNSASLEQALKLRPTLIDWCQKHLGVSGISGLSLADTDYHVKIRKAIAKGFIHHTAIRAFTFQQRLYLTLENDPVVLLRRSAIGADWEWVVYHRIDTTATGLEYMDRCTVVEENWLLVSCVSWVWKFANTFLRRKTIISIPSTCPKMTMGKFEREFNFHSPFGISHTTHDQQKYLHQAPALFRHSLS